MPAAAAERPPTHSQTLARGIRMLELVAAAPHPPTIAEVAEELGVHRSIAYRILRTLEDHSLLMRDDSGRLMGAPGLAVLAGGVQRDLQSAALPELTTLANELDMSAFIAVWDRHECTTLVSVQARHGHAAIAQRPGTRHSFDRGAPGIAIQSSHTPEEWNGLAPDQPYRREAEMAQEAGYATSRDEVIPGVSAVAVPLRLPGYLPAAVAVVYATRDVDEPAIGERLARSAAEIARVLGS